MIGSSVSVFMTSLLTTHQVITVIFLTNFVASSTKNIEKLLDCFSGVYLTNFVIFGKCLPLFVWHKIEKRKPRPFTYV
jgi:hypothetical protein